jgi:endonuclease/exonuclease/phosphatase family metal-dependent hydrolase
MVRWTWMLVLTALGCGGEEGSTDKVDYVPGGSSDDAEVPAEGPLVRVVTWNVQGLGSDEVEELEAVLARLDGDVVALNEIDAGDAGRLSALAASLGYGVIVRAPSEPFGETGNAVLSRLAVVQQQALDGAALSGDVSARDLTRRVIAVDVSVPGENRAVRVVASHLKSGFDVADGFRRAVDAARTAQAAARAGAPAATVVLGDLNQDPDQDLPASPPSWSAVPSGVPFSYALGADLAARLGGGGLSNDAFAAIEASGVSWRPSVQRDGTTPTRPTSGRRLDHAFVGGADVLRVDTEVYDCRDDGLPGLPLADGVTVGPNDCNRASDHLPVVVDVQLRGL